MDQIIQEKTIDHFVNILTKYGKESWQNLLLLNIIMKIENTRGGVTMNLGNILFHARKKCELSQETVAQKLGVSRQTISQWETNETVPDIYQAKKMAKLYRVSLDELI